MSREWQIRLFNWEHATLRILSVRSLQSKVGLYFPPEEQHPTHAQKMQLRTLVKTLLRLFMFRSQAKTFDIFVCF